MKTGKALSVSLNLQKKRKTGIGFYVLSVGLTIMLSFSLTGCGTLRKLFGEKEEEKPKAGSPAPKKRISFDKEPVAGGDAKPPPGYNPIWFAGIQPMDSSAGKENDLFMNISRVEARPDSIRLYLQIMDSSGTYYSGGNKGKWKNMWCFLVDSTIKDSTIIKKFSVKEWDEKNHEPVGAYLVTDFSGSMGNDRANFVQESLRDFMREKRSQDGFGLVKFDHYVNTVCKYTADTGIINRQLRAKGLEGYGGLTAINDALYKGIMETKSMPSRIKNRAIIMFSDGYDNCSRFTRDSIINLAREHRIPIHAVDFGDSTASNYLQDIALHTGGTYYHIYGTFEFGLVFRDIYRRMLNAYSVTFAPKDVGWHKVKVKLCIPKRSLSGSVWVNNTPRTDDERELYDRLRRLQPPAPPKPALPEKMPVNTIVYFDFNIEFPKSEEEPKIREAIALMSQYSGLKVKVLGHTDFVGETDFNRDLSIKRCEAVKRRFIDAGVPDTRVTIGAFGEDRPAKTNATKEGRARNRRVEIVFYTDPPSGE